MKIYKKLDNFEDIERIWNLWMLLAQFEIVGHQTSKVGLTRDIFGLMVTVFDEQDTFEKYGFS